MAEMPETQTPPKRQREETNDFSEENQDPKRQKSYDQILSLLEDEEEQGQDPNHDFSSILTTLQRELDPFSIPVSDCDPGGENPARLEEGEERDETERFMRHLLEASDDELGIPNRVDGGDGGGGEGINGGDEILFCDGLWDLEDDAANYYSLLQSELFM